MAPKYTAPDMIADWTSTDDGTVAELEAEQQKYAAQLAALRKEEQAEDVIPAGSMAAISDSRALAEENARLKEQLAAMASASAHRSTVRRAREGEEAAALLKKYTAENEKLAAALATGSGLSKLTVARPTASVIAASHARSASLVRVGFKHILYSVCRFSSAHPAIRLPLSKSLIVSKCIASPVPAASAVQPWAYICRLAASQDPVSRQVACVLSSETLRPERRAWTYAS